MTAYRKVEANAAGRDFVVGDVHGMFGSLDVVDGRTERPFGEYAVAT